jgi:hypothetical protein
MYMDNNYQRGQGYSYGIYDIDTGVKELWVVVIALLPTMLQM